jgi:release factor glutamine methyltransferase
MAESATHLFLYDGLLFRVETDVMIPKRGSILLARHMGVQPTDVVLDLGTGTGFLGILAARTARQVVATDVIPASVECARANAILNALAHKMDFRLGDLYAPVGGMTFDLILANPPQMPTPPGRDDLKDPRLLADDGGASGWAVLDRVLRDAPEHLRPGGRLLFTCFAFLGVRRALAKVEAAGLRGRIVGREVHPFPRVGLERLDHIRSLDDEGAIREEGGRLFVERLVVGAAVP